MVCRRSPRGRTNATSIWIPRSYAVSDRVYKGRTNATSIAIAGSVVGGLPEAAQMRLRSRSSDRTRSTTASTKVAQMQIRSGSPDRTRSATASTVGRKLSCERSRWLWLPFGRKRPFHSQAAIRSIGFNAKSKATFPISPISLLRDPFTIPDIGVSRRNPTQMRAPLRDSARGASGEQSPWTTGQLC